MRKVNGEDDIETLDELKKTLRAVERFVDRVTVQNNRLAYTKTALEKSQVECDRLRGELDAARRGHGTAP